MCPTANQGLDSKPFSKKLSGLWYIPPLHRVLFSVMSFRICVPFIILTYTFCMIARIRSWGGVRVTTCHYIGCTAVLWYLRAFIGLHLQGARICVVCVRMCLSLTVRSVSSLHGRPQRKYVLPWISSGKAPPSCAPSPTLLIRNEKPVLFRRFILCRHDIFIKTPCHNSLRVPLFLMGLVLKRVQWLFL